MHRRDVEMGLSSQPFAATSFAISNSSRCASASALPRASSADLRPRAAGVSPLRSASAAWLPRLLPWLDRPRTCTAADPGNCFRHQLDRRDGDSLGARLQRRRRVAASVHARKEGEWIPRLEGEHDIRIAHRLPRAAALIQRMAHGKFMRLPLSQTGACSASASCYEQLETLRRSSCAICIDHGTFGIHEQARHFLYCAFLACGWRDARKLGDRRPRGLSRRGISSPA